MRVALPLANHQRAIAVKRCLCDRYSHWQVFVSCRKQHAQRAAQRCPAARTGKRDGFWTGFALGGAMFGAVGFFFAPQVRTPYYNAAERVIPLHATGCLRVLMQVRQQETGCKVQHALCIALCYLQLVCFGIQYCLISLLHKLAARHCRGCFCTCHVLCCLRRQTSHHE